MYVVTTCTYGQKNLISRTECTMVFLSWSRSYLKNKIRTFTSGSASFAKIMHSNNKKVWKEFLIFSDDLQSFDAGGASMANETT